MAEVDDLAGRSLDCQNSKTSTSAGIVCACLSQSIRPQLSDTVGFLGRWSLDLRAAACPAWTTFKSRRTPCGLILWGLRIRFSPSTSIAQGNRACQLHLLYFAWTTWALRALPLPGMGDGDEDTLDSPQIIFRRNRACSIFKCSPKYRNTSAT